MAQEKLKFIILVLTITVFLQGICFSAGDVKKASGSRARKAEYGSTTVVGKVIHIDPKERDKPVVKVRDKSGKNIPIAIDPKRTRIYKGNKSYSLSELEEGEEISTRRPINKGLPGSNSVIIIPKKNFSFGSKE